MERKLHRIEGGNSVIGGVAAGFAEYFAIDVAIVRVIFVLGIFTPLTFAYLILWVALPRQFGTAPTVLNDSTNNLNSFTNMATTKQSSSQIGGYILVILGAIFLADEFLPWFDFGRLWPFILIGAGLWILMKDNKKTESNVSSTSESNITSEPLSADIPTVTDLPETNL